MNFRLQIILLTLFLYHLILLAVQGKDSIVLEGVTNMPILKTAYSCKDIPIKVKIKIETKKVMDVGGAYHSDKKVVSGEVFNLYKDTHKNLPHNTCGQVHTGKSIPKKSTIDEEGNYKIFIQATSNRPNGKRGAYRIKGNLQQAEVLSYDKKKFGENIVKFADSKNISADKKDTMKETNEESSTEAEDAKMQELQKQLELLTQQKLKKLESLRAIQSEKKTLLDLAEKKIKKEKEAKEKAKKEAARKKAIKEKNKKKAQEEAAQKKAQEEAAQNKAQEEAAQNKEEEKKRLEEQKQREKSLLSDDDEYQNEDNSFFDNLGE